MSSPATDAFLELWRQAAGDATTLALIALPREDGSGTDTIYAATAEADTKAGVVRGGPFVWEPLIADPGVTRAPGAFADTEVRLCSGSLSLYNRKLGFQADGATLFDTLHTHLWQSATVTVYLWVRELDDFDHALQQIRAEVVTVSTDEDTLQLALRQRTDCNRAMPDTVADRAKYPQMPEESNGAVLPVAYGALTDVEFREPFVPRPIAVRLPTNPAQDTFSSKLMGGRRTAPAVLVDTGRGGTNKAKVLVAGHPCKVVADFARGAGMFMKVGERLVALEAIVPGDVVNSATEAGLLLGDNTGNAWAPVWPSDVDLITNSAENPRAVLDPFNDFNYAKLDYAASKRTCKLVFPSVEDSGDPTGIYVFVGYSSTAGTNMKLRISRGIAYPPFAYVDAAMPATGGAVSFVYFFLASTWTGGTVPSQPWAFGELTVEFGWPQTSPAVVGTGTAELYFLGFSVNHNPRENVVESAREVVTVVSGPSLDPREWPSGGPPFIGPHTVRGMKPPVTELQGRFFGNVEGWQDDGAGTYAGETVQVVGTTVLGSNKLVFGGARLKYRDILAGIEIGDKITAVTGSGFAVGYTVISKTVNDPPANSELGFILSAGATNLTGQTVTILKASRLIERAPDIASHLLVRYGGESLANIERGASTFGSFIGARAKLRLPNNSSMRHAISIASTTDVFTVLEWLASSCMAQFGLSQFDDRWRMTVWDDSAPVDYALSFDADSIDNKLGPECEYLSAARVATGLRVAYGFDATNRSFAHETMLNSAGSTGGHRYLNLRDQYLSVVAGVNDRLDFAVATSGARTANLTAGSYSSVQAACQMVDAAMKTAFATDNYVVTPCNEIVAGYNDQFQVQDGPTARTVTLTAGVFATLAAMAASISADLVAAGAGGIGVVYASDIRKFVLWTTGTAPTIFRVLTGGLRSRRLFVTLGCDINFTEPTTTNALTAAYVREHGRVVIGVVSAGTCAIDLTFESGPNGMNGLKRDCHDLLGFDTLRDRLAQGFISSWLGNCSKGLLEQTMLLAGQRYRFKRDSTLDARAIYDTDTALELRRRAALLGSRGRVIIQFDTSRAPDMERGRVIQFTSDIDALKPYPEPGSNGSWVGKRFVVVETEQRRGPGTFSTNITAVSLRD